MKEIFGDWICGI